MDSMKKYVLHGFWGTRPEPLELSATRVRETLDVLKQCGAPLAGPWMDQNGQAMDAADDMAFAEDLKVGVARDSAGTPIPDAGYTAHHSLGDWSKPRSEKRDLGRVTVRTGGEHPFPDGLAAGVTVTFEGDALPEAARDCAEGLVRGLARVWQPEFMAFTTNELLSAQPDYSRYPSWAFVAWLSDSISRDLGSVKDAATSRFGDGTVIAIDGWDAQRAQSVWQGLIESKRIRAAETTQGRQPIFQ